MLAELFGSSKEEVLLTGFEEDNGDILRRLFIDSLHVEDEPLSGGDERQEIFVEQQRHLNSGFHFRDPPLGRQFPEKP